MKMNVQLQRKVSEIETYPCVVEKIVELSESDYAYFYQNLLNDYDFIRDNLDAMYEDGEGVFHCLLVLGEGQEDGILVESEGCSYARYSAFVSCARQIYRIGVQNHTRIACTFKQKG